MTILFRYLATDLIRNTALATVTLTLMVTIGGGISQMFAAKHVGAGKLVGIIFMMMPMAVVVSLPVGALFSAAITFGRAAHDNELTACRAAGLDPKKLLRPILLLGALVSIIWLTSLNFLIPRLMWSIEKTTRQDILSFVTNQLIDGKALSYGSFTLRASSCVEILPDDVEEIVEGDSQFLYLTGVAFMEDERGYLQRAGTAASMILAVSDTETSPQVSVLLRNGRSYDAQRMQFLEFDRQRMGPIDVPMPIVRSLRFKSLPALLSYRRDIALIPEIKPLVQKLKENLRSHYFIEHVESELNKSKGEAISLSLLTEDGKWLTIDAKRGAIGPQRQEVLLHDLVIHPTRDDGDESSRIQAKRAKLRLQQPIASDNAKLELVLIGSDGSLLKQRDGGENDVDDLLLFPFAMQDAMASPYRNFVNDGFAELTELHYLNRPHALKLNPELAKAQQRISIKAAYYAAEVHSELHMRLAVSLAWLPIIMIGAILGIRIRSGQMLVAFIASCVPCGSLAVLMLVARSLSEHPVQGYIGILMFWGSTILFCGISWLFGRYVLPR